MRHRKNTDVLAVGAVIEEAEKAFESGIGISVDPFGHVVIHKWVILVAYYAPAIGNLRDVSIAIALIGASAMPYLVVEYDDASCLSEVVVYFVFPLFPFFAYGDLTCICAKQVGTGYDFGGSVLNVSYIRKVVVAGEQDYRQVYISGRLAIGYDVMRWIVLMPGGNTAPVRCNK